jgi:hypothetical protein
MVKKYVCYSSKVWSLAEKYGWLPGARYTNLRDIRNAPTVGFLDIDWKNYNFERHLNAAILCRPDITVAQDVFEIEKLPQIIEQANILMKYSQRVIIVPKDIRLANNLERIIPADFIIGYSVPTRYGGTEIPLSSFGRREVHLLGGRPDRQRQLANNLNVVSIDTNRFTLDASFGDYFNGIRFVKHPIGGYERCLEDSLQNTNRIWAKYNPSHFEKSEDAVA